MNHVTFSTPNSLWEATLDAPINIKPSLFNLLAAARQFAISRLPQHHATCAQTPIPTFSPERTCLTIALLQDIYLFHVGLESHTTDPTGSFHRIEGLVWRSFLSKLGTLLPLHLRSTIEPLVLKFQVDYGSRISQSLATLASPTTFFCSLLSRLPLRQQCQK